MIIRTILLLFLVHLCFPGNGQQVVPAGGNVAKNGIDVDWVVGGRLILEWTPVDKVKSVSSDLPLEIPSTQFSLTVFPVPTRDFVSVQISPVPETEITFNVMDNTGKYVLKIISTKEIPLQINLSGLPPGVYLLRAIPSDSSIPVMNKKIIKT